MSRSVAIRGLVACLSALFVGCPTIGDTLPVVPLGDAGPDDATPADQGRIDRGRSDVGLLDAEPQGIPDVRPPPADAGPIADRGPPPDGALPDSGCRPGTPLGLCSVCGDDGAPTMPEDDGFCPEIDCGPLSRYALTAEDDALVCTGEHRFALTGRCRAVGVCHDDPGVYCTGQASAIEAEVVPGACIGLAGCDGAQPPQVVQAPEGNRCNDVGTCNGNGLCTANPACDDFDLPGESFFCSARDSHRTYCQFYLQAGAPISCSTFCQQNGWACDRAWNSMVGVCAHDPLIEDCAAAFDSFVCRCVP